MDQAYGVAYDESARVEDGAEDRFAIVRVVVQLYAMRFTRTMTTP
jgi:hypothetical protein